MDTAPADRWPQIEALFERLVDLPPEERRRVLAGHDLTESVRRELARLLRAHDRSAGFLETLDSERAGALVRGGGAPFEEGQWIGPYRVVRELGAGGMGVVLLAHDPRLDRPVALKLLPPHTGASGEAKDSLVREARAASALDHPNVVTIYDIGEMEDGRLFIAMAYHEGPTLRERLDGGALPLDEVLDVAEQMARGLRAAHDQGIVHRDIKPENVVLATGGTVKIVDFGIATMTGRMGSTAAVGTRAYMSPEQASGEEVDGRADLWALGVVMYEATTGVRPFDGDGGRTSLERILFDDPAPPCEIRSDLPQEVEAIVLRCLEKRPSDRFPDAADVLAAIAMLRSERPPVRRRSLLAGLAGAAALALALVGVALGWFRTSSSSIAFESGGVLVVPFVAASPDTALERLGTDLAITLSASLDGTAGLRVIEPITVLGQPELHGAAPSEGAVAEVARRLGATTVLRGALVRSADEVRVEATVLDSAGAEVGARFSASAPDGDLGALTDSVALGLLRHLATGDDIQAPSLRGITTSSVEALRHYLAGERAIARSQFRAAPQHFARAIDADSTFWFAYWRYAYARGYHGAPVDSAIRAAVVAHRSGFPEPDRRLVEAGMAGRRSESLALLEETTRLFPTYWPAWFRLGDLLTHHGPYLGHPPERARLALERTLALNPTFAPALEHLFWITNLQRDLARSEQILARLTAMRLDTLRRTEWNLDTLEFYRCLDVLARSDGLFDQECLASGVADVVGYGGPMVPERLALSVMRMSYPRAAAQLAELVRAESVPSEVSAAQWWVTAIASASRGDGDRAIEAARRYALASSHPNGPLWAYGLSVVSAWLGIVDPAEAIELRPLAEVADVLETEHGMVELAWLDGLLGLVREDSVAVRRALTGLRAGGSTAEPLLRSLEALVLADAGELEDSSRALAALEGELADRSWHYGSGSIHPFLNGVDRLAAARSLIETGDPVEAGRLLAWHEADLPGSLHPQGSVNTFLGTVALFEQGRVEEQRGRPDLALRRYRTFLERYDRAPSTHAWMIERARARLAASGGEATPPPP